MLPKLHLTWAGVMGVPRRVAAGRVGVVAACLRGSTLATQHGGPAWKAVSTPSIGHACCWQHMLLLRARAGWVAEAGLLLLLRHMLCTPHTAA
jgi:hypothetical protein